MFALPLARYEPPPSLPPLQQGNPSVNDALDFVPVLRQAKEMGLSLAIHLAEIDRPEDTAALMALPPDRIGVVVGCRVHALACVFFFKMILCVCSRKRQQRREV